MKNHRKHTVTTKKSLKHDDKKLPHFKHYYHYYLVMATVMLSLSALLFGLETIAIAHQLPIAGGLGVAGTFLLTAITW